MERGFKVRRYLLAGVLILLLTVTAIRRNRNVDSARLGEREGAQSIPSEIVQKGTQVSEVGAKLQLLSAPAAAQRENGEVGANREFSSYGKGGTPSAAEVGRSEGPLDIPLSNGAIREAVEKYQGLLPEDVEGQIDYEKIGVVERFPDDWGAFLQDRTRAQLSTREITPALFPQIRFLRLITGLEFGGPILLDATIPLEGEHKEALYLEFGARGVPSPHGEVTQVSGANQKLFEYRDSSYGDHFSAWRLNVSTQSVSYLQKSPAWLPQCELEMKDFVYSVEDQQLAGILYCLPRGSKDWKRIANFRLKPRKK